MKKHDWDIMYNHAFLFFNDITSIGHILVHLPQPIQASLLTYGRKLVVAIGCKAPYFFTAFKPSQQQLQQLHKKQISFLTFSPH